VFGVLWLALDRYRVVEALPAGWNQPILAVALTAGGLLCIATALLFKPTERRVAETSASGATGTAPDWSDPGFRAEVRDFLTKSAEEDKIQSMDALGDKHGRAQSRIALRPVWPQRPTQSWFGGVPSLPEGMDWPSFDGSPASFLAQISLDGLPETLWQGIGPRHGWLVFFTDPQCCTSIAVRHVSGRVEPRPQPQGVAQNWHWNTQPAALIDAQGLRHDTPPQWFLEVTEEPVLGSVEDIASGNKDFYNDDIGEYIWEPTWGEALHKTTRDLYWRRENLRLGFDWPSFFAVFGCWQDWLKDHYRSSADWAEKGPLENAQYRAREEAKRAELEAAIGTRPDAAYQLEKHLAEMERLVALRPQLEAKTRAKRDLLAKLCPEVEEMEQELRDFAMEQPFDQSFAKALATSMQELDKRLGAIGADTSHPHMQRDLPAAIETYARQLYTRDPEALPDEIRALFAPIWETQCRETVVFMGLNHPGQDGRQPDARLIDLPPNPLTGVTFGDMSRFYVDLPALALNAQDWTKAQSQDTHGM
jgi:hypothetical protein